MNSITVSGRLTRDVETRDIGEKVILKFSIAVNDKAGEKEVTSFFDVEKFVDSKYAAGYVKFLTKGSLVLVNGKMQQDEYTGKDGETKKAWRLKAFEIAGVPGKTDGEASEFPKASGKPAPAKAGSHTRRTAAKPAQSDEDVPF